MQEPIIIDVRGLKCPMPVLMFKKELKKLISVKKTDNMRYVELLFTDPNSLEDVMLLLEKLNIAIKENKADKESYKITVTI